MILFVVAAFANVFQYEQNISRITKTTTRTTTATNVVTEINVVTTTAAANTDSIIDSQYSKEIDASFVRHLQNLESLNTAQVLKDYLENSSVTLTGEPGELDGTYSGAANISLLMSGFLYDAVSLTITNITFLEQQNPETSQAIVNATFDLVEDNDILY